MIKLPLELALEEHLEEAGIKFLDRVYPDEARRMTAINRLINGIRYTRDPLVDSGIDLIVSGSNESLTQATLDDGYDFFYRVAHPRLDTRVEYMAKTSERNIKEHASVADQLVNSGKVAKELVTLSDNLDSFALVAFDPNSSYTSVEFDFFPDKSTTNRDLSKALSFLKRATPLLTPLQGNTATPDIIADAIAKVLLYNQ